jgi:hypothetical protein
MGRQSLLQNSPFKLLTKKETSQTEKMNLCCYTRTKVKKKEKMNLCCYTRTKVKIREDESLLLYKDKGYKKNREDEPLLLKIPCPTKVDETLWQGKHNKPVQMHLEKELPEV